MTPKIDPFEAMATAIFAGALLERCREMIARLTSVHTLAAEIDDFRELVVRHIDEAVITARGCTTAEAEEVKKLAREAVEETCSAWLGEQGGKQSDRRMLN